MMATQRTPDMTSSNLDWYTDSNGYEAIDAYGLNYNIDAHALTVRIGGDGFLLASYNGKVGASMDELTGWADVMVIFIETERER